MTEQVKREVSGWSIEPIAITLIIEYNIFIYLSDESAREAYGTENIIRMQRILIILEDIRRIYHVIYLLPQMFYLPEGEEMAG